MAGTHTGHTDRWRTSQLNRDSIRLSAAGPSCVGCARHGHRGRAAAAGVSVGFRSRVRGSGPRAGLGFGAGRGPGDWVQLKYLGTRGSPRWIILRKHPRVRGLPLPEPDTLWLVHTQKKQEQDPYRSDDSTMPHRNAPRANRILRARGRALAIRAACSWRARPQPSRTELCPQHPCS